MNINIILILAIAVLIAFLLMGESPKENFSGAQGICDMGCRYVLNDVIEKSSDKCMAISQNQNEYAKCMKNSDAGKSMDKCSSVCKSCE